MLSSAVVSRLWVSSCLAKCAQQSVHLTLGILRKSQAVSYAFSFFWLDGFAVPAPAQVPISAVVKGPLKINFLCVPGRITRAVEVVFFHGSFFSHSLFLNRHGSAFLASACEKKLSNEVGLTL